MVEILLSLLSLGGKNNAPRSVNIPGDMDGRAAGNTVYRRVTATLHIGEVHIPRFPEPSNHNEENIGKSQRQNNDPENYTE